MASTCDNDCDNLSSSINPNQFESCDGLDNNCDGSIDEGVTNTYYADFDSDGYGNPLESVQACSKPLGYIDNATDCDDTDASLNPADADSDGYSTCDNDCDDTSSVMNPNRSKSCDGLDNNCDGNVDEGVTNTYYADLDQDSYGDVSVSVQACTQPFAYIDNATDCDDTDASLNPADADSDGYSTCDNDDDNASSINPNQFEVCDSLDNNCDRDVDEGVTNTYYADLDQDGYGDPNVTASACTEPFAHTSNDSDCDGLSSINPDGIEVCNGLDDDCDGSIDDAFMTGSVYTDLYNCGSCGNDCTNQGYLNATPSIAMLLFPAAVWFTCDSGYFDANSDSSDGCECLFLSSVDAPFDGIDANCDGGDGDHNDAVHVVWGDPRVARAL